MIMNTILLCSMYQLMSWWELIDKLECSWCLCVWPMILINWFWYNCEELFQRFYIPCCDKIFCINCYVEVMKWWFKLWVCDKLNMWRMMKYMCIEMRCVYWVVSYELCNHTIIRPFKGDEYYDGIQCGDPTSLITSATR